MWDTALAIVALSDAGTAREHPALARAAQWLLEEEVRVRGDWAAARPALQPGGWAFEFENDNYPDVDDTAEVALALLRTIELEPEQTRRANRHRRRSGERAPAEGAQGVRERAQDAIDRAVEWVEGMQSEGGGWGAFDADNTRALVRALPFLDFGEVIDEPSADVTAHALEMLAALGRADSEKARAGLSWLLGQQEADGSWFGRWGINHIYGTGAALPALAAMGVGPEEPPIRRAVAWLHAHQNEDGGWGEDPRSYDDPAWIGRGDSTASQTAWALLALHAAGEAIEGSPAMERGVAWLISTQRPDGTWDEPQYTGTGFPSDYYINYHLYRLTFPIMALGRCGWSAGRGVPRWDRRGALALHAHGRPAAVMARAGGENFPVASRVLPRRVREHLLALYGFARLVDELGDAGAGADRRVGLQKAGGARLAGGGTGARVRRRGAPPAAGAPAGHRARMRAAARALPAADRGQPRRPARGALRHVGAAAGLLPSVGRPRGGAGAGRVRRRHPRAGGALGSDLHGAAAGRALAGRRRGSARRPDLPAGGGPGALRLHRARPRSTRRRTGA